jgi:hypothetical protein
LGINPPPLTQFFGSMHRKQIGWRGGVQNNNDTQSRGRVERSSAGADKQSRWCGDWVDVMTRTRKRKEMKEWTWVGLGFA